ncbi:uncharacterized protein LOC132723553 [Ruditapes philippinarum]|uniref:uncharacterized protein LOC132723553 n=1 Tax=Ruditapes philippinarum TaxID=129788 RepID=UPI00295B5533|nr:uncharacterized protein LOC132723553 [Ruditapes philippinarum]
MSAPISMSEIEEGYEVKDDSRPFFQRQPCEVGIYISVYEATPIDEKSIGLPHFFRMNTTDILYEEFRKKDIVKIRATFEHGRKLTDTYIERFEPGIVMAVGFDTVESLNSLWAIHRRGELTSLIHDVLITSDVLKAASITAITIETKLWDDEYDVCKHDISSRSPEVLDIQYRQHDLDMVKRLKSYQSVIATELSSMRDLDNEMELNRTDFMNCIRNLLPNDTEQISTLSEYEALAKSQKARKMYYKDLLDLYSTIIKTWRVYYDTFLSEMATEVTHPEMERKIIQKEAPMFLGLLSLVPLGVDRLAEIDILIDEYIREFKLGNELV